MTPPVSSLPDAACAHGQMTAGGDDLASGLFQTPARGHFDRRTGGGTPQDAGLAPSTAIAAGSEGTTSRVAESCTPAQPLRECGDHSHSVACPFQAADTGREGAPRTLPADQSRIGEPVADRVPGADPSPASEDWPGGVEHSASRHFSYATRQEGRRKLSAAQVVDLRRRWEAGERTRDLAVRFRISAPNVHRIASGQGYKEIPGGSYRPKPVALTEAVLRPLAMLGISQAEAARRLGVTPAAITFAKRRLGLEWVR